METDRLEMDRQVFARIVWAVYKAGVCEDVDIEDIPLDSDLRYANDVVRECFSYVHGFFDDEDEACRRMDAAVAQFEGRPMPDKPAPVRERPEYFVGMADGCEKVSVSHEKAPVSDDNAKRDKRPMGAHSVREKGCAYCCDEHWKRLELDRGWRGGRMELVRPANGGAWMLQAVGKDLHVLRSPVHYCPMCGRRLHELPPQTHLDMGHDTVVFDELT